MKANEIKEGGIYYAKVNNRLVEVKVKEIKRSWDNRSRYKVVNLKTNRVTTFRSAAKFQMVVPDFSWKELRHMLDSAPKQPVLS